MATLGRAVQVLTLMLVLRMVAAPVSARPDAPKGASDGYRFVLRRCAWSPQRPPVCEPKTVYRLPHGPRDVPAAAPARPSLGARPPAEAAAPLAASSVELAARRVDDGPRC
jgi:hypothetical protein